MTNDLPKRFTIHPNRAEVDRIPDAEFATSLKKFWIAQATMPRPDLERLIGTGQLARIRDAENVEPLLLEWVQHSSSSRKWDIAGSFSRGYWSGADAANEALVAYLLTGVPEVRPGTDNWTSLFTALAQSYKLVRDVELRDQLRAVIQRNYERASNSGMRELFDYVLSH